MKNLLLILVLANVLYWMWGLLSDDETEPGVAIVEESDLGPPLNVTADLNANGVASVGAVLGSGEPSALEAVVGRSCVTIGPFSNESDADSAVLEYSNRGMRTALRRNQGTVFVGHWVQIRDVADDAVAKKMLDALAAGGLSDAYLVRTEDEGLKISLGLFGDMDRAEKIELQAKSLDLAAEITPRTRDGTLTFVDVGLPPGVGAGEIIEQYSADQVLLRDKATCPK